MSAMNTHVMDAHLDKRNHGIDLNAGLRALIDATAACRQTAAQARKTLSGMEPDMRGLRLIVANAAL